ncbi:MAG: Dihydropyrimidinase [Frankiales bacterium]|nr:Dihydropyrimidinase [Frankiales bacterium]
MYDLIIKNGMVANEYVVLPLDLAVKDEKIVALGVAGQFADAEASRVIDAAGKYVVPGGIDTHVHYDFTVSEAMVAQTAEDGSRAGIWGGTTTYIDFARATDDENLIESIEEKLSVTASRNPHSDYALHSIIAGSWPQSTADAIKDAISGGVVSFKFFTTFSGGGSGIGGLMSDDGRIYSAMLQTQKHGGVVMVHCEDDCIIDYNVRRLYAQGREHFTNIGEARPPLAEEAAVRRMLLLSKRTGSPLFIVHVAAKESIEAITEARLQGVDAFAEVLHPNLLFSPELYNEPNGQRYMNYPPNKPLEHRDALWAAVANGNAHTVASDDFTIPWENKLTGDTIDTVTGGTNSVETRMPLLWSEGVAKRNLSITRFVEVNSAGPAKLFGLYGTKGVLRPGADADIVIMDPDLKHTYKQGENLHSGADYSNWDGWELEGFPAVTILRGHVMIEDGKWVGPTGIGRFVPGKSPENV